MSLSIVIPVYARKAKLARLLGSIARQATPSGELDVVVVENGRRWNQRWLREQRWPFHLVYEFVADGNPGRNRNVGAGLARGDRIFFVDSDIELTNQCLAQVARPTTRDTVAMTDVVPRRDQKLSLATHLYDVPAYFRRRFRANSRLTMSFRDFVTCAFVVHRSWFRTVGGFDEEFVHYGYEDVEFALRAEAAGARFRMLAATVSHHKALNPSTLLEREIGLGRSAVHFVDRHPGIEDRLPLGVRDTVEGRLTFATDYDIHALLAQASQVERKLALLRHRPRLRSAVDAVREGTDLYRQLCLFGRYKGVRLALADSGRETRQPCA